MAIQQINLGSMPLGAGGDSQRAANTKINQNFSNTTHAASRLVGTADGQVATWQLGNIEGIEKDSKTNLLLKVGDSVPENSAASRLVGTGPNNVLDVSAWENVNKAFNAKAGRNYLGNSAGAATKNNPGFTYTLDGDIKKLNAGDTVVLSGYFRADNIATKQAGDKAFVEVCISTTGGDVILHIAENNLSMKGRIERYIEDTVTLPGKPTGLRWGYSSIDCYRGAEADLELSQVKLEASTQGRTTWTPSFVDLYSVNNTTKDSNGFLKGKSPVTRLFSDRLEHQGNDRELEQIELEKLGVGDYLLKNTTGLANEGWYIELPQDANKNPLFAVTYNDDGKGSLSIKTYKRRFDFETVSIVADTDNPVDIPETRWIDLRFNEIEKDEVANEPIE